MTKVSRRGRQKQAKSHHHHLQEANAKFHALKIGFPHKNKLRENRDRGKPFPPFTIPRRNRWINQLGQTLSFHQQGEQAGHQAGHVDERHEWWIHDAWMKLWEKRKLNSSMGWRQWANDDGWMDGSVDYTGDIFNSLSTIIQHTPFETTFPPAHTPSSNNDPLSTNLAEKVDDKKKDTENVKPNFVPNFKLLYNVWTMTTMIKLEN